MLWGLWGVVGVLLGVREQKARSIGTRWAKGCVCASRVQRDGVGGAQKRRGQQQSSHRTKESRLWGWALHPVAPAPFMQPCRSGFWGDALSLPCAQLCS